MEDQNKTEEQGHFRLKAHGKENPQGNTGDKSRTGEEDRSASGKKRAFIRLVKVSTFRVLLYNAAQHVVAVVNANADADGGNRQRIDVHIDAPQVHNRLGQRLRDQ